MFTQANRRWWVTDRDGLLSLVLAPTLLSAFALVPHARTVSAAR